MTSRARAKITDRFPGQVTFDGAPREDGDLPVAHGIRFVGEVMVISADLLNTILERLDRLDALANKIVALSDNAQRVLLANRGKKKNRAALMIMGALCSEARTVDHVAAMAKKTIEMADELEMALSPHKSSECWGKGAAFGLAMEKARGIVVSTIAKDLGDFRSQSAAGR